MADAFEQVVKAKQRRLGILQLQQARYGIDTPPHIVIEIEQLEIELQEIANYSGRYLVRDNLPATVQPDPAPGLIILVSTQPVFNDPHVQSAFDAIDFHRSRLQHCWLIASGGERGSLHRAHELRDYFAARRIAIHIWQVEDPASIQETYQLIDWLYTQHVPAQGLSEREVIADITGSTKPMTIGMVLACGSERPIQYMIKHHNNQPSLPVLLQRAVG